MDELRARSFGEGSASGGAVKRKAKKSKRASGFNGVLTLTAAEYARFEECMTNPGDPTTASQEGAEMLRKLYESR
jgi:hypothetical protein